MAPGYDKGEEVEWDWGDGTARGRIAEVHEDDVKRVLKGSEVKRSASEDCPAYTIEQDDGDTVLKSHSEVRKVS